ncbi:MAG: flavodoxin domain-containing protein [Candidatus Heimdallarchaeota archaeon]
MSKVLILYGTRYGTTKAISNEIQKVIDDKGIITESYNLEELKIKELPPLQEYTGILIGTGIKIKRWTSDVKKFVQKRKTELISNQNKLGFYVCCGEAAKKNNISNAIDTYITSKLQKLGIKPALIDAFGGCYDLTEGSSITGMTRKIVISIMKNEEGIENPDGKLHDFRDWEQIREFANIFAELVEK